LDNCLRARLKGPSTATGFFLTAAVAAAIAAAIPTFLLCTSLLRAIGLPDARVDLLSVAAARSSSFGAACFVDLSFVNDNLGNARFLAAGFQILRNEIPADAAEASKKSTIALSNTLHVGNASALPL